MSKMLNFCVSIFNFCFGPSRTSQRTQLISIIKNNNGDKI